MKSKNTLNSEMRFCKDIGMFALDRQISSSCLHKTEYCETKCFNEKLFKLYPNMHKKDIRNEIAWKDNNYMDFAKSINNRKLFTDRFRMMTRGECFSVYGDIDKTVNIVKSVPTSIFWIPTRAWRNPVLFAYVLKAFKDIKNVRILASMDKSNTIGEWEHIKNMGISTMFFGENNMLKTPMGEKMFMCPKTHKHLKGHCAICKGGCFRTSKRVNVHLKEH